MATDEDLGAALRRAYQALAPEVADRFPSAVAASPAAADDAWAEWEERAAIREYDGGMSRADAEILTEQERQHSLLNQGASAGRPHDS